MSNDLVRAISIELDILAHQPGYERVKWNQKILSVYSKKECNTIDSGVNISHPRSEPQSTLTSYR